MKIMNDSVNSFKFRRRDTRGKRVMKVAIAILAFFLIVVLFVGIITDFEGAESGNISAAIAENTQLKQRVEELTAENERLKSEIERLNGEIALLPTIEPTPYVPERTEVQQQTEITQQQPDTPRSER